MRNCKMQNLHCIICKTIMQKCFRILDVHVTLTVQPAHLLLMHVGLCIMSFVQCTEACLVSLYRILCIVICANASMYSVMYIFIFK